MLICLENYKLDAAWYYTSPGLAWDAMLKKTGATLEQLTDVNMFLMFKNGIRGCVAMASNRLASVKQTINIWVKITIVVNVRNIYNT